MVLNKIIEELESYSLEIDEILPSIQTYENKLLRVSSESVKRYSQIVVELTELITDHIPQAKITAEKITGIYSLATAYELGESTPKAGLQETKVLINALIKRAKRTPSIIDSEINIRIDDGNKSEILRSGLDTVIEKFHQVAVQIKRRYNDRDTLEINDEYDVQDLFHSLLKLYFKDIRPEEWNPSYAGGSSRSDFLLPDINTIIEVKKTRASMTDRHLGEQLLVDIAKYKKHPQCENLICFVYDPEGLISNPRGIENDLTNCDPNIKVRTIIVPKHE